ncbi:MAG: molybdenum-pterin-binding protein [Candidatus Korarchaeota archaeon]|nr:molybdenum-pterin-binding protein [Candidatus Korarchaeota archaeon]
MKTSARNKIEGTITGIEVGKVAASVKIEIGTGEVLTAVITRESVEKMDLETGDEVHAMIKATSVMIAKE